MSADNFRELMNLLEDFSKIPFGQWVSYDNDSAEHIKDTLHRDAGYLAPFDTDQFDDAIVFYSIDDVKSTPGNYSPQAVDPEEYQGTRTVSSTPKYVLLFNDRDEMLAMPYDDINSRSIQHDAEQAAQAAADKSDVDDSDFDPRY